MNNIRYNFRLGPEAFWLIVNVTVSTVILSVLATDFTVAGFDVATWGIALGLSLVTRTIPAALIAVATDGFQLPGERKEMTVQEIANTPVEDGEVLHAPYFPEE